MTVRILGKKRNQILTPVDQTYYGWPTEILGRFFENLSKPHSRVSINITGFEQLIHLSGPVVKNNLVGNSQYPAVRAEGALAVASGERRIALDKGVLGDLTVSALGMGGEPHQPLIEFNLHTQSELEESILVDSIRASLGCGGAVWINLGLVAVSDPVAEMTKFKSQGYSSRFAVHAIHLGSHVGSGPFN